MNCKLEKFWNAFLFPINVFSPKMNCKLEKFWNKDEMIEAKMDALIWTVNLKSFEIR